MKKKLRTLSVYFLSALLVLSSSAWKFSTFHCSQSGYAHYNIGQDSDCCDGHGHESSETTIEASCCDFNSIQFGLDLIQNKKFVPDVEVISIDQEHVLGIEIPETEKLQSNLANAPPTKIKLYKIFGVYLI